MCARDIRPPSCVVRDEVGPEGRSETGGDDDGAARVDGGEC